MRIGTIGAGKMAEALAGGWTRAGHEVLIGARRPQQATDLAARLGGPTQGGTLHEAAQFGDVTLLAVPGESVGNALRAAGAGDGAFGGHTLIDCTNAFATDSFLSPPGSFRLANETRAVAEHVAEVAIGAHVVKAFSMLAAEVWLGEERTFDGRQLSVPLCGDNLAALMVVNSLVTDLGLHPILAGDLRRARYMEAMTAFVMGLWFAGHDARATLPPLEAAFAVPD